MLTNIQTSMAENQLINELLCFLVNKLECMPADLLVKLLIYDFYDDKEIDYARECLFSFLPVSLEANNANFLVSNGAV